MIDYSELYKALEKSDANKWLETLADSVERATNSPRHGELDKWLEMLDALPDVKPSSIHLASEISL